MRSDVDVTGREVKIAAATQTPALGSAMFGAVAAGKYDKLYAEYVILHDYFGRGANDVMKRLKAMRADVRKL